MMKFEHVIRYGVKGNIRGESAERETRERGKRGQPEPRANLSGFRFPLSAFRFSVSAFRVPRSAFRFSVVALQDGSLGQADKGKP